MPKRWNSTGAPSCASVPAWSATRLPRRKSARKSAKLAASRNRRSGRPRLLDGQEVRSEIAIRRQNLWEGPGRVSSRRRISGRRAISTIGGGRGREAIPPRFGPFWSEHSQCARRLGRSRSSGCHPTWRRGIWRTILACVISYASSAIRHRSTAMRTTLACGAMRCGACYSRGGGRELAQSRCPAGHLMLSLPPRPAAQKTR
jgi:hypothetical protein